MAQFELKEVDYSKSYEDQSACKRHVVGAYANMARHNMTIVINNIMQSINMELFEENHISNAFSKEHRKKLTKMDNIRKVDLQKRLFRYFPFFKRMKLEDEDKKMVLLDKMLLVMSDFTSCMAIIRNKYTHYCPYDSKGEKKRQMELMKKMGENLKYLFENSSKVFRANEDLKQEEYEVLSRIRIRKGQKFVHNPKYEASMTSDTKGMSDVAIIYFLCLFLEKGDAFKLMQEVGFTSQISFRGEHAEEQLLFLQEMMCMNRIRMIKTKLDSEMSDTALALDMISELRKCPKPLFQVFGKDGRKEFKDDATVNWEEQNHREAVLTEDLEQEEETAETIDKNTPRSTFVRWEDRFPLMAMRYIDLSGMFEDIRFQLRLGKYRFRFYQHDKTYSIDSQERLRIIQKELHGFGRIQEVNAAMKEKWEGLFNETYIKDGLTQKKPDEPGQKPYVTEQNAQYAIDQKAYSIGLRWEGWEPTGGGNHYGDLDNNKMFIPHLPKNPVVTEKTVNQAEKLLAPQAMMSLYELPALLFLQYLAKKYIKDKHKAESIIKEYFKSMALFLDDAASGKLKPLAGDSVKNVRKQEVLWKKRKTELNAVLKEYGLKDTDISTKLRDYLCLRTIDYNTKLYKSALGRLKEKKEKAEHSLNTFLTKKKRIGTKQNKFGKNRDTIKAAQLAKWLIRDIWDWLPNNGACLTKLTGQSYAALEAAFAMFGQYDKDSESINDKNLLTGILRNAELIAKGKDDRGVYTDQHPFLREVMNQLQKDSIDELFERYIKRELKHIESVEDCIRHGESFDDYLKIPFLHCERERWEQQDDDTMRNLARKYMNRPLQLPDGLFTEHIYSLLTAIDNPGLNNILKEAYSIDPEKDMTRNTSFLINAYFEHVEHDHAQPFYDTTAIDGSPSPYRHTYRIFKKLYGKEMPPTNRKTTPSYTIEEIRDIRKRAFADLSGLVDADVRQWKDDELPKFKKKVKDRLDKEKKKQIKEHKKPLDFVAELNKAINLKIASVREEFSKKHKSRLKHVYDNERTIRRFKTQDVLLLMMARDILKAQNPEREFTDDFKLKYVMTDSVLDMPIDFEWKITFKDKDKKRITKTITQKGMKMKNYGQFYKFASDHQRLESLMSQLSDESFLRSEIENEFSYYDQNRSEVFRQVYIIESLAYKMMPALLDDNNDNQEWFYFVNKKGEKIPRRNNFTNLLKILVAGKDGILDDKEEKMLEDIRNAFGHNTYDVDMSAVFEGKEKKKKIPEVANGIKDKVIEETSNLKS